ncbi:MAG: hypothetical protein R3282_05790, partial [Rhodothermales bacterium]|nr:hypothetical protein [Rhodothermales bacterium]
LMAACHALVAMIDGMEGKDDAARRYLVEHESETGVNAQFNKSVVYMGLGDVESAIASIERSIPHAGGLYLIRTPLFRPLHGHPAFAKLLKQMNLSDDR